MIAGRSLAAVTLLLAATALTAQPRAEGGPSVFDGFPVPTPSRTLLFYIQRNKNANTIVYEANLDANGRLVAKDPVRVQWIRYTEGGGRGDLSVLESNVAYGVRHVGNTDGRADMRFVASDRFPFNVTVTDDGQAEARMMIDGHYARLDHIRVQAREDSWWPKVAYVDIIGTDLVTRARVTQRYIP